MNAVHLIACPRPFSMQQIAREVPEGATIAALMRDIGLNPDPLFARVFIDDRLIHKAEWEYATPKAGQFVTVRVIPTGGGGGGKDALRIVAMIGVVIASIYTAGAAGAGLGTLLGVSAQTGSAIAGAAVSIVGSLAIGALIPPAKPKLQDLSRLNLSPALSLTGSSNQLAPYAPIPRVYGRYRSFPPLAATPYTETVGSTQYLRLLFCCGYGPLALSEMKIGATPLEQFHGVELEVRYGYPDDAPITLIPDDIVEDALSIPLTQAGGYQQRTSRPNARELSVDVTFPGGLGFLGETGTTVTTRIVDITVEYRRVGDPDWIVVDDTPAVAASYLFDPNGADNALVITAATGGERGNRIGVWFLMGDALSAVLIDVYVVQVTVVEGVTTANELKAILEEASVGLYTVALAPGNDGTGAVALGSNFFAQLAGGLDYVPSLPAHDAQIKSVTFPVRWKVHDPDATYEVRLKRLTDDNPQTTVRDLSYWTTLRTIQTGSPVAKPGLCLVALRIRATDQLTGTVDQFNLLAESILPDWNGETWLARPTSNPASIYRNILQGSANARPLPDSRVDLTRLAAFHDSCTAQGWRFNANIDYRSTVYELSRDVLAAGRASLHQQDGKFTVVEDLPQTLAKQLITPRNSWGFRGTRVFSDLPHALKVRFVNPEKDWQQDERIVYADGYSETNASQFEALELIGITDPELAWKLARYHLAVAMLRPETYEVNMDVEHLVCSRGDLVLVQHDVPLFGLITGRIKGVATDSYGRATALTLDEPCVMQAGDRYGVRVRLQDNTYVQCEVLNVPGSQTTVTLLSPI